MDSENGSARKLYNPQALCDAIGFMPKEIMAVVKKSGVARPTVIKAMDGDPRIGLITLIAIVEASGAKYEAVFDPEFYEANRPESVEAN